MYQLSLRDIDYTVSLLEACLLTRALLRDPASRIHAAVAGWKHPWPHEARVLADLFDVFVAANSDPKKRKPKPYPRPYKDATAKAPTRSARPVIDQARIRAELAKRGH